jgi:hypothetical protein
MADLNPNCFAMPIKHARALRRSIVASNLGASFVDPDVKVKCGKSVSDVIKLQNVVTNRVYHVSRLQ